MMVCKTAPYVSLEKPLERISEYGHPAAINPLKALKIEDDIRVPREPIRADDGANETIHRPQVKLGGERNGDHT